jgi:hypothetical protein
VEASKILLVDERLHAEYAPTGFFEFGRIDHDWSQAFLREDLFKVAGEARSKESAVGYDAVPHELQGFVPG